MSADEDGPRRFDAEERVPSDEAPEAVTALLKRLARILCEGPSENIETAPPTFDAQALRYYLLARERAQALRDPAAVASRDAFEYIAQAFQHDADCDAAFRLLEAVNELYLSEDRLPKPLACRELDRFIQEGRTSPLLLRQRGLLELQEGRVEAAMPWFRRALDSGDNREACAYLLARCAEEREDWREMQGWVHLLLEAAPENPAHHALAGHCASKNGNPAVAVRYWRRSLEMDPNQTDTRVSLALALLEQGEAQAAFEEIEPQLDRPDLPWEVMEAAIDILSATGRKGRASELLEEYLESHTLDAARLLDIVWALKRLDRAERAAGVLELILHLDPEGEKGDVAARLLCEHREPGFEEKFQSAATAVMNGEGEYWVPELIRWAARHPFCWHIDYLLANAYWQAGEIETACRIFSGANEKRPCSADLLARWGGALLELGDLPQAERRTRQALAHDRSNPLYFTNLSLALGLQGKMREAYAALRSARRLDPDCTALPGVRRVLEDCWRRQKSGRPVSSPSGRLSLKQALDRVLEEERLESEVRLPRPVSREEESGPDVSSTGLSVREEAELHHPLRRLLQAFKEIVRFRRHD